MALIQASPKMVYDSSGELIEVILTAADFRTYLQTLASSADWELLPPYLQDAVDQLLIDEVRAEEGEAVDLETAFGKLGG